MIEQYLKSLGRPVADFIATTKPEAERRFLCHRLTPDPCSMSGVDCAKRHASARVRWAGAGLTYGADNYNSANDRNDQTCATCATGSARAEILGIVSKRRARKPRPKYGKALALAIKLRPDDVAGRLGRRSFTTADLRIGFRWTENTIKKWMIHYADLGEIRRGERDGLFFRWLIL